MASSSKDDTFSSHHSSENIRRHGSAEKGAKVTKYGSNTTQDEGAIVPVGREHLSSALPPHESYEGRHRWDPSLEWTEAEEKKVVRKTDMFLLSWICVRVFPLVDHTTTSSIPQGSACLSSVVLTYPR